MGKRWLAGRNWLAPGWLACCGRVGSWKVELAGPWLVGLLWSVLFMIVNRYCVHADKTSVIIMHASIFESVAKEEGGWRRMMEFGRRFLPTQ